MTTIDPVLARVAEEDRELHHKVVEALLALGGDCERAVADYEGLPLDLLRAWSSKATRLRSIFASRPDCPADLLREFGSNAHDNVRRAVAGNRATPQEVLLLLASDGDRWVRFDAFHNTNATSEVKAAAALVSTPDELAKPARDVAENPETSPDVLRRIARKSLHDQNGYGTRSELAANPNFPDDDIPMLVAAAEHRWEWRSLWARREEMRRMLRVWPSTFAFMDPSTPHWALEALMAAGHPAGLLRTDSPGADCSTDPADGLVQLVNSGLLTRALWRELALAGAVTLEYWNDSLEGDHFFPTSPAVNLMEAMKPAEYLVGGYSGQREWIEKQDVLSIDRIIGILANGWEMGSLADFLEWVSEDNVNIVSLGAVGYAIDRQLVDGLRLTPKGETAMVNLVEESLLLESDDYDTEVRVVDSSLKQIGFADTSDRQKQALVTLLRESRSDVMLSTWGISSHFLMCVALHPLTPDDIRMELAKDTESQVREAATVGAGGAQAGVVFRDPSSKLKPS